ncbi:MAG: hypothetical protein NT079_02465, partial [Candidatus Omnitrophica bacterium]|nr:hypothetical protein [Candidatus Omnitrophota bacterium]
MKNLQRVVIIFIFIAVVVATYGLELRGRYVVPIMTYHSISADGTPESMNSVTKRNFDYQMAFLKRNKYHVISLDELTSAIKEKRLLPRNSVVLTIDDGYADNYENA